MLAGKSHPDDRFGKAIIARLVSAERRHPGQVIYLENYDMALGRMLTRGCDVWLNNPIRPLEASGTSGMKAGLNGALNFSVLDGWWREAYNGKNGWSIGEDKNTEVTDAQDHADAQDLYDKLENEIIPTFYKRDINNVPMEWVELMKESIKTVTPQFSTRRMVKEYVERLYAKALG